MICIEVAITDHWGAVGATEIECALSCATTSLGKGVESEAPIAFAHEIPITVTAVK